MTAVPKIELSVGLTFREVLEIEHEIGKSLPVVGIGVYLLDVDSAEIAVAWLKAHGVEQDHPARPLWPR